jgi:hypothetical protein
VTWAKGMIASRFFCVPSVPLSRACRLKPATETRLADTRVFLTTKAVRSGTPVLSYQYRFHPGRTHFHIGGDAEDLPKPLKRWFGAAHQGRLEDAARRAAAWIRPLGTAAAQPRRIGAHQRAECSPKQFSWRLRMDNLASPSLARIRTYPESISPSSRAACSRLAVGPVRSSPCHGHRDFLKGMTACIHSLSHVMVTAEGG